jgi:hypothetical protein
MSSPKKNKLNQKIHIGLMDIMEHISAALYQTLEQIATHEFHDPVVFQLSQTNHIYVSLVDKNDLEVNLIESEN